MKTLLKVSLVAAVATFVWSACAADDAADSSAPKDSDDDELVIEEEDDLSVKVDAPRKNAAMWPAFIAVWDFPETPDLVGLRLTLPYSTKQESITGFDIGFWGRSLYFEGVQANILRNDVKDGCAGVQAGCYNSVARGDLLGVQFGLWNEAQSYRGVQFGVVNVAGDAQGFQFGIINRSETMYGFQVGLINVIRDAEIQFCPVVNVGF
ncbi:MAG: hypothetical protein IJ829_02625 [Kiritimatiellae bacterium]|nr:hypothetical protein [Kiritimatiellia bacterium]